MYQDTIVMLLYSDDPMPKDTVAFLWQLYTQIILPSYKYIMSYLRMHYMITHVSLCVTKGKEAYY